jgi:electron transport complex protein RnfG
MSGHEHKDSGVLAIALNLTAACAISGVILATVYVLTKDTAEKAEIELKNSSMRKLVPEAAEFKKLEIEEEVPGHGLKKLDCYECLAKDASKPMAYIIPSEPKGYGGSINMLVAIAPDERVMNYTILSANETPGLGDKAGVPPFSSQFKGKDLAHLKVVKDPSDKEDILAITGATISSKAVTLGVKTALELYINRIEGASKSK